MMLRSSSTPILGSLLSSYSESPNHNHNTEFNSPTYLPKKLPFHHNQAGHLHLTSPSSRSFNSCPSVNHELTSNDRGNAQRNGFRRAQSEGNLEGLLSEYSCNSFDEFNHSHLTKKFPRKPGCAVLQTIPSFSVYNPSRKCEEGDEEEEEEEDEEEESGEESENEMSMEMKSGQMSMECFNSMMLQDSNVLVRESEDVPYKMHLASGLGVMYGGFNGGGGGHKKHKTREFGGEGEDGVSMEEYYKKMVEANPGNPLFLRNYAQFLHKSKDLRGAEEYYSRALLFDPGDGEILSQYAQVTWELHGDEDRAMSYFERSVQASPEDSHVQAAYAGFLWETEEVEDDLCTMPPLLKDNAIAAVF